ncbi:I78 family peptidase inhibitor [Rhodobacter sp. CZR27]|uniref:I78 family peptidase inhibitor n=1 Tax=Rhodobacter sp. CZR27 TaxID=2033869 RepID=UPI000BBEDA5F|nr:I78 family peptidase inhibitor [Rhodobacter sp. CZR27]
MRRTLILLTALASLSACGKDKETEIVLPTDSCGAVRLKGLVGQPVEVFDSIRFSQPVRIVRPGDVVTMDFSPARLTVETTATDRISRLSCG